MQQIAEFSKSDAICAVSVGKATEDFTHCGILYETHDTGSKKTFLLHLGNPVSLDNTPEESYLKANAHFVWKPFPYPTALLTLVKSRCIAIHKANSLLPYGIFHDDDSEFDANGKMILGADSDGLTCSSFVKTILKSIGINIIDDSDWPVDRPEDLIWLKKLAKHYKDSISWWTDEIAKLRLNSNPENIIKISVYENRIKRYSDALSRMTDSIKHEYEFKRFRPEEIAGAAYSEISEQPLKFEYFQPDTKIGAKERGKAIFDALPQVPIVK